MNLIQIRKQLYDGLETQELYTTVFPVYDYAFPLKEAIRHQFIALKPLLSDSEFSELVTSSGFETNENSSFKERFRKDFPDHQFGSGEHYTSPDGLQLYWKILNDNLLFLFSFGEVQPARYQFFTEGVWRIDTSHEFRGNMGEPDTISSYVLLYGVDPRTHQLPIKNLQQLHDTLIVNGCNRFYIAAEAIGGPENSDVEVLDFSNDKWTVYYTERGIKNNPIFTNADKDEVIAFYYNHIMSLEHLHLVVFTRQEAVLMEYQERLESAGIRSIENNIPHYKEKGDYVCRLFVSGADIFKVRDLFPVVPYYDDFIPEKNKADHSFIEEQKQEVIEENNNANTSQFQPIPEIQSENAPVETFVPFHDDDYFPEIKSHNTTLFNNQFNQLIKVTAALGIISLGLHLFHADGVSSLFLFFFIVLFLWLIIFRFKQDTSKPSFKITKDGVFLNQQFLRNAFVPWSNIAKAEQRGFTDTPAIVITFANVENLLKDQFFVFRSIAKAQLNPKPIMVISQFETEGDLNRTFEIMRQYLPSDKIEPKAIHYDYEDKGIANEPEGNYTRLSAKMTKAYFREIVAEALQQAEADYNRHPDFPFHESFYNQLNDIQKTVIEKNVVYTENEAYKKYPMSIMAARNFEDDPRVYIKQISDIVWGISKYPEMPEELDHKSR